MDRKQRADAHLKPVMVYVGPTPAKSQPRVSVNDPKLAKATRDDISKGRKGRPSGQR